MHGRLAGIVEARQRHIAARIISQAEDIRRELRQLADDLRRKCVEGKRADFLREHRRSEAHRKAVAVSANIEHVAARGQARCEVT